MNATRPATSQLSGEGPREGERFRLFRALEQVGGVGQQFIRRGIEVLPEQVLARLGESRVEDLAAGLLIAWPRSGAFVSAWMDDGNWWLSFLLADPQHCVPIQEGQGQEFEGVDRLCFAIETWCTALEGTRTAPVPLSEYLALLEASDRRLEWHKGDIVCMAGATPNHNDIAANLLVALRTRLGRGRCKVTQSDLKVRVSQASYRFPDIVVTCGPRNFVDGDPNTITNPTLLAEVISPESRARDRQTKAEEYRSIPSLQHYLLVDSTHQAITLHTRDSTGWVEQIFTPGEQIPLTHLSVQLDWAEVYEGVLL